MSPSTPEFVVGVGASAGGSEALEQLFRALPAGQDAAYVVVQHLSPDSESRLPELLVLGAHLPVEMVEDGALLCRDVVYLVPPNKAMVLAAGKMILSDRGDGLSHPIDVLFCSLARDVGRRSVAIVLSGTGRDGSRGIRDVHEAGGFVMAQGQDGAASDTLTAVRETAAVDRVLAPGGMPALLERYFSQSAAERECERQREVEDPVGESVGDELAPLFGLLRSEHDVDFFNYNKATLGRRIQRRAHLNGLALHDYKSMLETDRNERNALTRDFLVGVTHFFRDPGVFDHLEREVVPEIIEHAKRDGRRQIRAWVGGCATGEEAYSIAMLFREGLLANGNGLRFKLFATDVHREALETASAGLYSEKSVERLSPERREKHFERRNGSFQVHRDLRKTVEFTTHDILRNAPFEHLDLVSCRNLLIYLKAEAQKKLLSHFHFALRAKGVLVLGNSETPVVLEGAFEPYRGARRVYRKRRDVRSPLAVRSTIEGGAGGEGAASRPAGLRRRRDGIRNLEAEPHGSQESLPSTIEELKVANEELRAANEELVDSHRDLQRTNEDLRSVNEQLSTIDTEHQLEVAALTRLAEDTDDLLATTEVGVMLLDEELTIRKFTPRLAEILRLEERDLGRRVGSLAHALCDGQLEADSKRVLATGKRCERDVEDERGDRYLLRILPCRSKRDARGVVVTLIDIDPAPTAESQLRRLSDIVASSEEAIIGKDLSGIITSWNRGATKIYGFTEEEAMGQPISMLFPEGRKDDAEKILERIRRGEVLEGLEVQRLRKGGGRAQVRLTISPVRDEHGTIVGASAIGHDITGRRRAEEALAESEQRLRLALESGHMGTFELELERHQIRVDENFATLCGLSPDRSELDLSVWLDRVHPDDRAIVLRAVRAAVDGGGSYATEFRVVLSDGRDRWLAGRGAVVRGDGDRGPRMLGVVFDITGTKRAERRLSAVHSVTSALAGANSWADAVPEILRALSHRLPAEVCELWMKEADAPDRMVCVHSHSTLGAKTPRAYTHLGNGAVFERGEGLPGKVLATGKPVWLGAGGGVDEQGPEAPAFASALGFPVTSRDNVDAVITCFSTERQREDPVLLQMLAALGSQLGEFYRWTESENARRRSDERLRETLDTLVPFVGLCKPDGTLMEANRSLLDAADIEPSEVLGKPFYDSSWFTWSPKVQRQLREAIARAAGGDPSRFDVDIRIGHDAFVTLDLKIVPMADESGNVTDLVASGVDVTARKAAEQTLRDLNDELERRVVERTEKLERRTALLQHMSRQLARVEQNERKRLAGILHDHLQQLIAAAKIRLDLLEDQLTDETSLEHLTNARDSLEEAVGASRNLAAELSPPILETAALPETLKWLVRRVYEIHRIKVDFEEEQVPPVAYDTKVYLFQATRELIFNVVKHASVDRCSLRLFRGAGGDIHLALGDNGVGFDPAVVLGADAESTGLGLLSLKERLEGLGGRMLVESSPSDGTSIELVAPALQDEEPAEVERPSVPARRGAARAGARRRAQPDGRVRVLIVDDHQIVREGLASILSAQPGIEVAGEAQDGEEAVDLALAIEPDVVLMDVDLPGLNGIEATRRIKAEAPRVRVIGLSIHEESEVAESMLNAGASHFLTKGGHPERLFRRILEDRSDDDGKPGRA